MKNNRISVAVHATLAIAVLSSTTAVAQAQMPLYQILDLGTLGGVEAAGLDINDLGEVTGAAARADGSQHAFIYRDGEMIDLGTLKADRYGSGASSGADINNKGEVAGQSETDDGLSRAVVFSRESVTDLGTLGGFSSNAYSINESGQVSGIAYLTGNSEYHAFRYSGAEGMEDLGTLGDAYSTGDHINDAGEVAGIYQLQFASHAYLYSRGSLVDLMPGQFSYLAPARVTLNSAGHVAGSYRPGDFSRAFLHRDGAGVDLGTLGGAFSFSSSINDADQVTGDSTVVSGDTHAFRWSAGEMQDLGTLGGRYSNGTAINSSGEVTGQASTADSLYHPFVYSNGAMIDLGLPEGGLEGFAVAINAIGQVTGIYQADTDDGFFPRGFIATPISLLFSRLGDKADGHGPVSILADTARLAGWYYRHSDSKRTCAALKVFEIEATVLSYDRKLRDRMQGLIVDGRSMKSMLGCAGSTQTDSDQSAKAPVTVAALAARKVVTPADKERAMQWYRQRFGIGPNGILIEGRLTSRRL